MARKERCRRIRYGARTRKSMTFFSPSNLEVFSGYINFLCAEELSPWDSLLE